MKDEYKPLILPGLTEDETRYFQYVLCKKIGQVTEKEWKDIATLNQKILKVMYEETL